MMEKKRAPRNRTLTLSAEDRVRYSDNLTSLSHPVSQSEIVDCLIHQDIFEAIDCLPSSSIDLLFADPPYNLTKNFNGRTFSQLDPSVYEEWLDSWISKTARLLKPTASIYVCGDWRSSASIHRVLSRHFKVRNRITWEREKGRGAKANWKNCSEDIWFATVSDDYVFNVDAVKVKRQVIAPYKDTSGKPKDWVESKSGNYRLTHPSNLWSDLTVPFWSMPENTDHPTQKPEKLLAKIILASSNEGDLVFDPFLGSGTTAATATKLNRHYVGVEIDETYCLLAEKRIEMARRDKSIQGYSDGVFWERNMLSEQKKASLQQRTSNAQLSLFS